MHFEGYEFLKIVRSYIFRIYIIDKLILIYNLNYKLTLSLNTDFIIKYCICCILSANIANIAHRL